MSCVVISAMVGVGALARQIASTSWVVTRRRCETGDPTVREAGGFGLTSRGCSDRGRGPGKTRPKVPKLVTDPQLAEAVTERLEMGWSPHAVAANLRNEGSLVAGVRGDYLSGVLRAVRCSWLDRRLLAVASAPPQAAEATQPL